MMNKKVSIILILSILLPLSSCYKVVGDALPKRAAGRFDSQLADSSPDFAKGWYDGCEVGMSAGANSFYKMFHQTNQADGYKMANSSDYRVSWTNGFWWCYRKDFVKQKSSIWGSILSGFK